ncbi:MAG: methyltransferase domain-containing protein [Actinobacteria bacterium]|nr:methyltransferase domain-containing protein [Actinomycetota bacterium]MBV8563627.1 methyltransferase domain-containing protein [Actinomycetota bacterium]
MAAFIDFVLNQLPPAPGRVLEIGCGREGGLVEELVAEGYDAIGVDPEAPEGERFVQARFQDYEPEGEFDAVVAGRVLHHVRPLGRGVEILARFAPLLLVDEFAWDLIDPAAQQWYEGQHRMLRATGAEPPGPRSIDEWWSRHPDLHPHWLVLDTLRDVYSERRLDWEPYLYRWLGGPSSEQLERTLVEAGAFNAIGWHFAGVRRDR